MSRNKNRTLGEQSLLTLISEKGTAISNNDDYS